MIQTVGGRKDPQNGRWIACALGNAFRRSYSTSQMKIPFTTCLKSRRERESSVSIYQRLWPMFAPTFTPNGTEMRRSLRTLGDFYKVAFFAKRSTLWDKTCHPAQNKATQSRSHAIGLGILNFAGKFDFHISGGHIRKAHRVVPQDLGMGKRAGIIYSQYTNNKQQKQMDDSKQI